MTNIAKKTFKTDSQIQQDVLNELKWDTRIQSTDVGVKVDNSVVTLAGTVGSWATKTAAAEAAHRVAGVLDVANDITVKLHSSTERNDTEIAAALRQALLWDVFVPEDKIQTTVTNGTVTLRGEVDHASERDDAARAIHNITGVRVVDNRIEVKHVEVSKLAIRTAIRDALERRADREAGRIELEIDHGKVTVEGAVGSRAERQAVLGAALGTRGVDQVIDRLHVRLPVV